MTDAEREAKDIAKRCIDPFIAVGHLNCPYSDVSGDAKKAIVEAIQRAEQRGREYDPHMTKTFPDGTSETHPRSRLIEYLDFQVKEQYRKGLLRGAEIAENFANMSACKRIGEAIRKEADETKQTPTD